MGRISAEIAELQRLCASGADGLQLFPTLNHTLHKILPTAHNAFFWLNESGSPVGGYHEIESHAPFALHYIQTFANNLEKGVIPLLGQVVKNPNQIFGSSAGDRKVVESRLYDEVWRPINCFHVVEVGVGPGVLMLIREKSDSNFSAADHRMIAQVLPHLRIAFENRTSGNNFKSTGRDAILIVNAEGKIEMMTSGSHQILKFIEGLNFVGSYSAGQVRLKEFEPLFIRLTKKALAIQFGQGSSPPREIIRNPWGEFVVRAFNMIAPGSNANPTHFTISIEHRVPSALWFSKKVDQLALSPKEKNIAFWIAFKDLNQSELASRLNITVHTVITHVRHIFQKLQISSRGELKELLDRT